jgi:hypothetical protein
VEIGARPVIEENMKSKLPIDNYEPAGTYQVWHRDGEAYRHVANVEAGNYMAAVVLPLFERGTPGTELVTWLAEPARPTTFGDKIIDPLGAPYEIYKPDFGGVALRKTSVPEARQASTVPRDQASHPTPSQIANSNKYKLSSPDQGKSGGKEHSHSKDDGHTM